MRIQWLGLLAAGASLQCAQPATAARQLEALMTMEGECQQLNVLNHDFTHGCEPRFVNEVYADGRTGFTFTLRTGSIVTFSGRAAQVKQGPDAAIQPIDTVIWNFGSGARPIPAAAVGRCRFTNPYKGPATVDCSATSKEGEYVGKFVTDGAAPTERTF